MELNPWIESVTGVEPPRKASLATIRAAADVLGEKPRTVYAWYRRDRIPSFGAALNSTIKSKGAVDWNGIFIPFARLAIEVGGESAA